MGRPESNLLERSSAFFEEIASHAYCFERRQREAEVLLCTPKAELKAELTAWFMSGLHPASPTRRKLAVWVVGSGEQAPGKPSVSATAPAASMTATSGASDESDSDSDDGDGGGDSDDGDDGDAPAADNNSRIPEYADYITPTPIGSINVYRQQMAMLHCPFDVMKNVKLASEGKK